MVGACGYQKVWYELIRQIGVGILVGAASALLTARVALRKYRSEKWWQRKADAYAQILQALHIMKRGLEEDLRDMKSHPTPYDTPERKESFARFRQAQGRIHEAVDTGSFLLSDEARIAIEKLVSDLDNAAELSTEHVLGMGKYTIPEEATERELDAIRACLDRLPELAKRDLAVK